MSQGEYEALMNAMNEGFAAIHGKFDGFQREFFAHQLACSKLFGTLNEDMALRKQSEATALWPKIRQALAIAASLAILGAAAKVMVSHSGLF